MNGNERSLPPMPETLTGLIERVTYHNPENGFAVLRVVGQRPCRIW